MKSKFLLILVSLIITVDINAQENNAIKLYGYAQPVSQGISATREIDESGKVIKRNNNPASFTYYIYLVIPANARIYPVSIWIEGTPYTAKASRVGTPVEIMNNNIPDHPKAITLVPETTQKVLQLTPVPLVDSESPAKFKSLTKTNALVVIYKMNGKFYSAVLKKLERIAPQALQ